MPNKPWTKKEISILLESTDKSTIEIANRSKKSIRRKLILLGLIKPNFTIKFHKKTPWSEEEIEKLKSADNFAKVKINRSRQSIYTMAKRLGIIEKKPQRKPWEKKNIELLMQLFQEGKKPSEIHKMGILPHSKTSIQKKIASLGLKYECSLKKKEEDIKKSKGTIKFIEDSIKMCRANIMRERISSNRDIWTGLPLENQELNQADI